MAIVEVTGQRNTFASDQGTSSIVLTYPGTPTSGNLLVCSLAWRSNLTVTGVPSGWSLATNGGNGSGMDSAIYYKIAGSSEPTTHTFTMSASGHCAANAFEYSGIATTSPLDITDLATGSTTTATTGATGTLAQADELVYTLWANIRSDDSFTSWDNGLSLVGNAVSINGTTAARVRCKTATKIVSSTASVTYTGTMDFSQTWSIATATFKAAATAIIINGSATSLTITGSQGSVIIGNTISGSVASLVTTTSQGSVIQTTGITEVTGQRNTFNTGANTAVVAYPGTPTQGNLLVVAMAWRSNATITSVPTGWNLATNGGDQAGVDSAIYYKIAGASEPTGHTFTFSVATQKAGAALEYSGVTTLDKVSGNVGSNTAGTTGATGTLSTANELVVALFSNNVSTESWSAHDNGLTEIVEVASANATATSNVVTSIATKVTSATTSTNYGATLSLARNWSTAVATFMPADGSVTINGSTPSLAIAGQSSTVIIGNTLAGSVAALTLTGQAGTLIIGNTLSGNAGSLTITGQTGSVVIGNILTGSAASISLTGQSGSVLAGDTVNGNAASLSLTTSSGTALLGKTVSGSIDEITLTGVTGSPILGTTHPVRYIRDSLNGSLGNGASYWVEIQAYDSSGTNIASGKTVTANFTPVDNTLSYITNSDTNTNNYVSSSQSHSRVVVDLGATYDIASVTTWHYNGDNRTFYGTKTETSVDGITWTVIFNSAVSGEYAEQTGGRNFLTLPAPSPSIQNLSTIIPAYTTDWSAYTSTANATNYAIINPNSGPGTVEDSAITSKVTAYHAAGGKILGYVSTSYAGSVNTARTVAAVKADIDTYISLYSIDGFFLDEFTSANTTDNVNYYSEIYSYIKGLGSYFVCGNVGTAPAEVYASTPLADNLIVFEGTPSSLANFAMPTWTDKYADSTFGWIVTGVSSANDASAIVTRARNENAYYVFVTDDVAPNPYDTTPPYWAAFASTLVGGNYINSGTEQLQITSEQGFLLTNNFVSGSVVSLSVTSSQGTLIIGNTISGSVGTLALTPSPGAVVTGSEMIGQVATLSLQPQSGLVSIASIVLGSASSITISGQSGSISIGNTLEGNASALSLSAQAGELVSGNTISGSIGSVSLSGIQGSVYQSTTIDAAIAGLTLTGAQGTVEAGNVINGTESALSLTPSTGELIAALNIDGVSAELLIDGTAGEVSIGNTLDGTSTGLTLTPETGIVIKGNVLSGTIDELVIEGITGSIHKTTIVEGSSTQVILSGSIGRVIAGSSSISSFSIIAKDAYLNIAAEDSEFSIQSKDSYFSIGASE